MKPGDLVLCEPFTFEYNPEVDAPSFVGLYMGKRPGSTGSNINQYGILGPDGFIWLWCNRWSVELVNETR